MKWKKIKRIIDQIRFKYSPFIPDVDFSDFESRRSWILFMAQKTGRFPVREVYNKMKDHLSTVSINHDLRKLEEAGLIRREKLKNQKSFVIPLFEDSGEATMSLVDKKRELYLNFGLPSLSLFLLIIFIIIY